MLTSKPTLLLDTNVWLDIYLPRRPQGNVALALVREAISRDASLAFPSQSILDVYQRVLVENKRWIREAGELTEAHSLAVRRMARDCVNDMREMAVAIPVGASDLYLACAFRDAHDDLRAKPPHEGQSAKSAQVVCYSSLLENARGLAGEAIPRHRVDG